MAEWVQVIIVAGIAVMIFEARINLGTRLAVMERDLAWLTASLAKWGLAVPGHDVAIRLAPADEHDKRTPEPPTRGR
jgi:hypothetical protein